MHILLKPYSIKMWYPISNIFFTPRKKIIYKSQSVHLYFYVCLNDVYQFFCVCSFLDTIGSLIIFSTDTNFDLHKSVCFWFIVDNLLKKCLRCMLIILICTTGNIWYELLSNFKFEFYKNWIWMDIFRTSDMLLCN